MVLVAGHLLGTVLGDVAHERRLLRLGADATTVGMARRGGIHLLRRGGEHRFWIQSLVLLLFLRAMESFL
jgi:hypothetical protein